MQTFRNHPSWRAYRDILAAEFGIRFETEPDEQVVEIRGHAVRYDDWRPEGPPVGVVILVHGGGGNGRVLAPFAPPAVRAGWRVIAPDLPGYGLTQPAPGFAWDYAEWPAVVAALADRQTQPVVLIGASMGGMTALAAAAASAHVRGVVATTLLDLSDPETFEIAARWRWLGRISRALMRHATGVVDAMRGPLSLFAPLRAMSGSPAMRTYFDTDPLIGARWISGRFFRTAHAFRPAGLDLRCPVLLAHPGGDDWTPTRLSLSVFERIRGPKRFIELSNGSHLPVEQPAYDELGAAVAGFLEEIAGGAREG